jgi:hypothetical protein
MASSVAALNRLLRETSHQLANRQPTARIVKPNAISIYGADISSADNGSRLHPLTKEVGCKPQLCRSRGRDPEVFANLAAK